MTAHTVTLNQLEAHLWEAANILRGPVDAADFKTYVFPLLFFKRLSDVHDESTRQRWRNPGATRHTPASHKTTASRCQKAATGVMCER
jgi:type I restriction-modification system DNA methylase subunit